MVKVKKLEKGLQAFVDQAAKSGQAAKGVRLMAEYGASPEKINKVLKAPKKKKTKDPLRDLADTEADYKTLKKFVERKPKTVKEAVVKVEEPELAPETKQTREEWLLKMTRDHCSDLFAKAGKELPANIRMSCGWPSSRAMTGKKGRTVGQCWYPEASSDSHFEIFISPALSDVQEVCGTLIHELVHVVCGKAAGHGPRFKEVATGVGLEGKMTHTTSGTWLKEWTEKAAAAIGPYPHAKLDMTQVKKQPTRLLKIVCINPECDFLAEEEKPYSVRMSVSVFEAGKPCCGVCGDRMEEADEATNTDGRKKTKGATKSADTEEEDEDGL